MEFEEFQSWSRTTAVYPKDEAIEYTYMGLVSEVGELGGIFKRIIRDETYPDRETLIKEIGDVLWYLTRLTDECSISLEEVAEANRVKLEDRRSRNVIKGEGDER